MPPFQHTRAHAHALTQSCTHRHTQNPPMTYMSFEAVLLKIREKETERVECYIVDVTNSSDLNTWPSTPCVNEASYFLAHCTNTKSIPRANNSACISYCCYCNFQGAALYLPADIVHNFKSDILEECSKYKLHKKATKDTRSSYRQEELKCCKKYSVCINSFNISKEKIVPHTVHVSGPILC